MIGRLNSKWMIAIWIAISAMEFALAQDINQIKVPLSDPSRPGLVKVNLLAGSILVQGYSGQEIIVEAKTRGGNESQGRRRPARAETEGMKKIPNLSAGLTVEEEDNTVSISARLRPMDIKLRVPTKTNLRLHSVNGEEIRVEQLEGEMEINNTNGTVILTQVSGSVVAHSLNGDVKVSIVGLAPGKSMAFSSMNGDIDVTFPPDLKANVSMKSDFGDIYSDFDIKLDTSSILPTTEPAREKDGKRRVKLERISRGTINGGGQELQFKTYNGDIYIRKSAR